MHKLLVGIIIEAFIGITVAGVLLALVVPALNRFDSSGERDLAATIVVCGVLAAAVAVALFRPGSTIHRYMKR